jgi:hypothetical protein
LRREDVGDIILYRSVIVTSFMDIYSISDYGAWNVQATVANTGFEQAD